MTTLNCQQCGAAVPLKIAGQVQCRHCRATIEIPANWRAAAEAHAAEERVRREVEPRWHQLATGVDARLEWLAVGLLFITPPALTFVAQSQLSPPPTPAENLGWFAFPGLLPGALLWLWAAAVNATVLRIRRVLRARQDDRSGELGCRNCGAPLAPDGDAPTATCLYCGTDSLVRDLPPAATSIAARDQALRTLGDAVRALRRRRVNLALGIAVIGTGVAAVVAGTAFTVSLVFGA